MGFGTTSFKAVEIVRFEIINSVVDDKLRQVVYTYAWEVSNVDGVTIDSLDVESIGEASCTVYDEDYVVKLSAGSLKDTLVLPKFTSIDNDLNVESFTVTPTEMNYDESESYEVQLDFVLNNAGFAFIVDDNGNNIFTEENITNKIKYAVSVKTNITKTTNFVLNVSDDPVILTDLRQTVLQHTATATVIDHRLSIDSYASTDYSISEGEAVTLSWTTTNASEVTINDESKEANGSMTIAPVDTTLYTIRAKNDSGDEVIDNLTIKVDSIERDLEGQLTLVYFKSESDIYEVALGSTINLVFESIFADDFSIRLVETGEIFLDQVGTENSTSGVYNRVFTTPIIANELEQYTFELFLRQTDRGLETDRIIETLVIEATAPRIVTFVPTAYEVDMDSYVTLSWTTKRSDKITLTNLHTGITFLLESEAVNSYYTTQITKETKFELIAYHQLIDGTFSEEIDTETVTVTINEVDKEDPLVNKKDQPDNSQYDEAVKFLYHSELVRNYDEKESVTYKGDVDTYYKDGLSEEIMGNETTIMASTSLIKTITSALLMVISLIASTFVSTGILLTKTVAAPFVHIIGYYFAASFKRSSVWGIDIMVAYLAKHRYISLCEDIINTDTYCDSHKEINLKRDAFYMSDEDYNKNMAILTEKCNTVGQSEVDLAGYAEWLKGKVEELADIGEQSAKLLDKKSKNGIQVTTRDVGSAALTVRAHAYLQHAIYTKHIETTSRETIILEDDPLENMTEEMIDDMFVHLNDAEKEVFNNKMQAEVKPIFINLFPV